MAPFNSESFPDCLAVASSTHLMIGTVDNIQKLHTRTIPLLGEQPRRIAHHKASKSLAVCTAAYVNVADDDPASALVERCFVRLFDDVSFEPVASFELQEFEQPMAIITGVYVFVVLPHPSLWSNVSPMPRRMARLLS